MTLSGTFDVPAGTYRLEFFANPSGADPTGYGEGEVFVGAATLTHTGSGPEPFGAAFPGSAGDVITATITEDSGGGYGSTSEFSSAVIVTGFGGSVLDSSSRRTDLDARGGLDLAVSGSGVVGNGVDLAAGPQRLVGPATDLLSNELTLSAWVHLDAAGTDPRILAKAATDGAAIYELLVDDITGEAVARLAIGGATVELRGGTVGLGGWHMVAATWDSATAQLYVDGVEVASAAAAGSLATDVSVPLVVGNVASADRGLDGRVDQIEIAHVARSPQWIATANANLSDAAGFVTIGAVQTSAPRSWTVSGLGGRGSTYALSAPETPSGADAWITAIGIDEPGIEFESWWHLSDPSGVDVAAGTRTGADPITQHETALTGAGFDLATIVSAGGRTQDAPPAGSVAAITWTKVVIRTDETGTGSVWVDDVPVIGPTPQGPGEARGSVGFRVGHLPVGETWITDDVRLRRLVSDEPVTVLGPLDRN